MEKESYKKPTVKLIGEDGNAFAVIGKTKKALRKAGASKDVIDCYTTEAMGGDYANVLVTTMKYVNVE